MSHTLFLLSFTLLLLLPTVLTASPHFNLTSPNRTSELTANSTVNITWTSLQNDTFPKTALLKLDLYLGNVTNSGNGTNATNKLVLPIGMNIPANMSGLVWQVPVLNETSGLYYIGLAVQEGMSLVGQNVSVVRNESVNSTNFKIDAPPPGSPQSTVVIQPTVIVVVCDDKVAEKKCVANGLVYLGKCQCGKVGQAKASDKKSGVGKLSVRMGVVVSALAVVYGLVWLD